MNIYVGNLDYGVDEQQLTEIFEAHGAVSESKIITDKYSGRSKGFGFVTMENQEEAENAIRELNGMTLENREITVNEARPRNNN